MNPTPWWINMLIAAALVVAGHILLGPKPIQETRIAVVDIDAVIQRAVEARLAGESNLMTPAELEDALSLAVSRVSEQGYIVLPAGATLAVPAQHDLTHWVAEQVGLKRTHTERPDG